MIEEVFTLVALLVGIFIRDFRLAVVSFVVAPLAAIPHGRLQPPAQEERARPAQVKMGQIYGLLHETITGNKIVKAFTTEQFEIKKFVKATAGYLRTSIKLAWIGSLSSPFMEFLGGRRRRLHPLGRDEADRRGGHQPRRLRRLHHGPLPDVHARSSA